MAAPKINVEVQPTILTSSGSPADLAAIGSTLYRCSIDHQGRGL